MTFTQYTENILETSWEFHSKNDDILMKTEASNRRWDIVLLLSDLESEERTRFKDKDLTNPSKLSYFVSPWLTHSTLPSWPTCSLPLLFLIKEGSIEFPFISVYNAAAISLWQAGLTEVSSGIMPLVLSFALWSSFITSTQMKSQDSETVACPELLTLSLAIFHNTGAGTENG